MKKVGLGISLAALVLLAGAAVFLVRQPETGTQEQPTGIAPVALRWDGQMYYWFGDEVEALVEPEPVGTVAGEVSAARLPEEDGASNLSGSLGAPVARWETGMAMLYEGRWVYFGPELPE